MARDVRPNPWAEDKQRRRPDWSALAPWWEALRAVFWPFLLARLALLLWGVLLAVAVGSVDDYGQVTLATWPWDTSLGEWSEHVLLKPWLHYDVHLYLDLAVEGYALHPNGAGFYPLHPLSIRVVWHLVRHPMAAATLLNAVEQLLLLACLYRFVGEEYSPSLGRWAVVSLITFPLAFVLAVPYSETPFLLATVLAFWAARRRNWLSAGVAGAFAAGIRQPGLFLLPALALEWLLWAVHERRRQAWLAGLPLLLIPVIPVLFTLYLGNLGIVQFSWQDPWGLFQAVAEVQQRYWDSRFVMPWTMIRLVVERMALGLDGHFMLDLLWGVLLTLLALASLRTWRRPGAVAYVLLTVLAAWSKVEGLYITSPIRALPRRLLVLFPIYAFLGHFLEHRLGRIVWWALAPALLLVESALFVRNAWIP